MHLFIRRTIVVAIALVGVWAVAADGARKKGRAKPLFASKMITSRTRGHAVDIDVNIAGAKKLYLVVESGGNISCDHADWAEPRLEGPKGTRKLTDLKWKSASTGWGSVRKNRSVAGSAMRINGKSVAYGIGTHADSVIEFDLPAGYTRFRARAGLDNSGTDQAAGAQAGVIFKVYTQAPPQAGGMAAGETFVPLDLFEVMPGFEITVWATSPMLFNPTNMDVDHKGRVWVAEGVRYRGRGRSRRPEGDRIVVLEDTDGDGRADKNWTFVQEKGFVAPLGVAVIGNKVIVSQPPDLIVFTDVNRNAKFDPGVDKREVILTGFNGKNHDHSLHSVTAGPSGQWYFNHGNMGSHVKDKDGWELKAGSAYSMKHIAGHKSSDGHVYLGGVALRVNPDGSGLRPIGHNFRNSYEQTVTSFGDVFQNDNDDPPAARTAWLMEYGNAGFCSNNGKRSWGHDRRWGQGTPVAEWRQEDPGSMPAGDVYGGGSPTGICFYENGAFGAKGRGLLLSCEPARNVVFGYYPKPSGAGFKLERFEFVTSNPEKDFAGADFRRGRMGRLNTLFRPSDVCVGPDGAVYIADWFDARVGGHDTRDNSLSGTIYRVVPKGARLSIPTVDLTTTAGQIDALKSSAANVRNSGFQRLKAQGERARASVKRLLRDANPYMQARAVWLLVQLGPRGVADVESLLSHKDAQMRIVAFRALRFVKSDMLKHAAKLAKDRSPAVRREVALAMRDIPFSQCKDILTDIAKGYDGKDRWYLEAFGTGCSGKETETYALLKSSLGRRPSSWNARFAGIAWRLHPLSAISDLKAYALTQRIPLKERQRMLVAIGVMDAPQAAFAMVDVAKRGPDGIRDEAKRWVEKRHRDLWRKHDALGVLRGQKTPKVTYEDLIVPTQLGQRSQLPSAAQILRMRGDADRGKVVAGRCIVCHRIGGMGVEFGPTLTGWGRGQPRDVILKAILDPSAVISHGFDGAEIKTTSGKTIQGFVLAEGDPVVVRTYGGQSVAIDARDIASRRKTTGSFMVSAADQGLSAQQVRDIVEYLKVLK